MSSYDHLNRVLFRYIMTGLEIVRVGIHKVVVQKAARMNVYSVRIAKFFTPETARETHGTRMIPCSNTFYYVVYYAFYTQYRVQLQVLQ